MDPSDVPETIENVYGSRSYATEYSKLDWGGTYHLIARDLPTILRENVPPGHALDFGCGTGRSTRLLKDLGYHAVGMDISEAMVTIARDLDPQGEYVVVENGNYSTLPVDKFDLILSCFPFDNIPTAEIKLAILQDLKKLLSPAGVFVNVVSSPEIYRHEWATFTTAPFPENRLAQSGDVVRIITTTFADSPVCEDILFDEASYRHLYNQSGFRVVAKHEPLGHNDDGVEWKTETTIAPWVIWVLSGNS